MVKREKIKTPVFCSIGVVPVNYVGILDLSEAAYVHSDRLVEKEI
jgi:hypothetical protein